MGVPQEGQASPTDPSIRCFPALHFLMKSGLHRRPSCHLDPYVGFLHSLDYGRHSLVLDLMEEFRTLSPIP